ncbi:hypothetical protein [Bdellovibrio reynosensis]|uniref:PH domain-containing protein n=1 Tax=Bdellovibrio reynosensis TaxID=2835041 RepID=A0ABY4C9W8_9BACT|nr:hypothetical protein [Bdellovibrio reynosensis]UOF01763.1 hypothetical protein MNR06_02195 [Bdellovibrio reynosensis]
MKIIESPDKIEVIGIHNGTKVIYLIFCLMFAIAPVSFALNNRWDDVSLSDVVLYNVMFFAGAAWIFILWEQSKSKMTISEGSIRITALVSRKNMFIQNEKIRLSYSSGRFPGCGFTIHVGDKYFYYHFPTKRSAANFAKLIQSKYRGEILVNPKL